MAVKVLTSFQMLMKYAHELAQARLSGDKERIDEAQKAHNDYVDLFLNHSDGMVIGKRGDFDLFRPKG